MSDRNAAQNSSNPAAFASASASASASAAVDWDGLLDDAPLTATHLSPAGAGDSAHEARVAVAAVSIVAQAPGTASAGSGAGRAQTHAHVQALMQVQSRAQRQAVAAAPAAGKLPSPARAPSASGDEDGDEIDENDEDDEDAEDDGDGGDNDDDYEPGGTLRMRNSRSENQRDGQGVGKRGQKRRRRSGSEASGSGNVSGADGGDAFVDYGDASHSNSQDASQPSGARAPKWRVTEPQKAILLGEFERQPYPTHDQKAVIATRVGVTAPQISKWFQHHRETLGRAGKFTVHFNRARRTPEETKVLQACFDENPYPTAEQFASLNSHLENVTEKQVRLWFKHHRKQLARKGSTTQAQPERSPNNRRIGTTADAGEKAWEPWLKTLPGKPDPHRRTKKNDRDKAWPVNESLDDIVNIPASGSGARSPPRPANGYSPRRDGCQYGGGSAKQQRRRQDQYASHLTQSKGYGPPWPAVNPYHSGPVGEGSSSSHRPPGAGPSAPPDGLFWPGMSPPGLAAGHHLPPPSAPYGFRPSHVNHPVYFSYGHPFQPYQQMPGGQPYQQMPGGFERRGPYYGNATGVASSSELPPWPHVPQLHVGAPPDADFRDTHPPKQEFVGDQTRQRDDKPQEKRSDSLKPPVERRSALAQPRSPQTQPRSPQSQMRSPQTRRRSPPSSPLQQRQEESISLDGLQPTGRTGRGQTQPGSDARANRQSVRSARNREGADYSARGETTASPPRQEQQQAGRPPPEISSVFSPLELASLHGALAMCSEDVTLAGIERVAIFLQRDLADVSDWFHAERRSREFLTRLEAERGAWNAKHPSRKRNKK